MASLPSYVKFQLPGAGEQPSDIVQRSAVERGVPRTRRIASDVLMTISVRIVFFSVSEAMGFRDWYYSPTGGAAGAGWFDWVDPRTNTTRSVRFVSSSMGALLALAGSFRISEQSCAIEYVHRAY